MSIQEEINRIDQNVANTYAALNEMGATMPAKQNSNNLAQTVRTVPQSGGGGEAVQEIFYVDATYDSDSETLTTDTTLDVIESMVDSGKYVVMRMRVIEYESREELFTAFLPLSMYAIMDMALFHGTLTVSFEDDGMMYFLEATVGIAVNGECEVILSLTDTMPMIGS